MRLRPAPAGGVDGGGAVTCRGIAGVCAAGTGRRRRWTGSRSPIARYGMTIFARIDHGAAAEKAGLELRADRRPGVRQSARRDTRSCRRRRRIAIDLPLKTLVWQDDADATWLAYNDPVWISRRHGLVDDGSVDLVIDALAAIAERSNDDDEHSRDRFVGLARPDPGAAARARRPQGGGPRPRRRADHGDRGLGGRSRAGASASSARTASRPSCMPRRATSRTSRPTTIRSSWR